MKSRYKKTLPFRAWFYFRMGWSTYFAFIFAAVNTLVVIVIGIPLLVLFGYVHFKKSQAYSSEADIGVESNPYYFKLPPGHQRDVLVPLQLLLSQMILKIAINEKITTEEIDKLKDIQKKLDILIQGGSLDK